MNPSLMAAIESRPFAVNDTDAGHAAVWRMPDVINSDVRLSGSPLLDSILYRRGVTSEAQARAFLNPQSVELADPHLLPDMQRAVELIRTTIDCNGRIVVFGDYDVDGITATAMLVRVLRRLGADPVPIVPHRVDDGYGVNPVSLRRILDAQPRLVISVDCGSSSPDEFSKILEAGAHAIVLDHHAYSGTLPSDVAFVSARRPENLYPEQNLAAVGVAFALVRALLGDDDAEMYLPYVALGSVADVVELLGENRTLVARGLSMLRRWTLPGMRMLSQSAGLDQSSVDAWDIGFVLGPRLNAAGRVHTPQLALDLLLANDVETAAPLAVSLSQLNEVRQAETRRITDEAEERLARLGGPDRNPAVVLSGVGWSVGVAGLVAARLAERHCRPAIVMANEGRISRGSARSVADVDIVEALSSCADLLDRFGGHSAAAGLTVASENVEELRRRLSATVLEMLGGKMPRRVHDIDAVATHDDLTLDTVAELNRLEPCGQGNPRPALLVPAVRHRYAKTSRDGSHLMFQIVDRFGNRHRAIMFRSGYRLRELQSAPLIDLVAHFERDSWQGQTRLNLRVVDFRATSELVAP